MGGFARNRKRGGRGRLAASLLAMVLASVGCTNVRIDFESVPPDEAWAAIEPGVTTRAEVIRRLGPPEEMRRLSPFERARGSTPQERRVLEAGEVFGREVYTWASETRTIESFGLLPVGPALFRVTWNRSRERRLHVAFDEGGVVRAVARVDETR